MSKLISVIIPAYNLENYLERCLISVAQQTYTHLEIIVINDGSTDRTGEIANHFAMKDNRLIVIHQENKGVSTARNNGLEMAKGDYIGFVDGDDEIEGEMYDLLYRNMREYQADISHCGMQLVKPHSIVKFHDTGILLVQNKYEAIKELLSGIRVEPSACNKLYKKEICKAVTFPVDIKINEDLLFNIQAFHKAEKSVFEDLPKYKYTANLNSSSRTAKTLQKSEDVFEVVKRVKSLLTAPEIKEEVNRFYVTRLMNTLKSLKSQNLYDTDLAKNHRIEVRNIDTSKMGLRVNTLKILLIDFPLLYSGFIYIYNLFFAKNQKWK